jgi:hypothetical protein
LRRRPLAPLIHCLSIYELFDKKVYFGNNGIARSAFSFREAEDSDAEEVMINRLALTFSLVGLLLYGSAISASAVTAHHAPASRPSSQGHYCTARAEPAGSVTIPTVTCYSTFSASIRAATGGRVRLPASAKPGSVTPDELNAAATTVTPATVFVLSIDYKDINFGGATLTWTQSSGCGSFQASSMPSGWNDVVSSVVTRSGCANTLYKNINFGGTTFSIGRNSSAANVGSFNDQTSSEKWCTARPC